MQVLLSGSLLFRQDQSSVNSTLESQIDPLAVPSGNMMGINNLLYHRVADREDPRTLELAVDMLRRDNPSITDYKPTIAIVTTWFFKNGDDPVR